MKRQCLQHCFAISGWRDIHQPIVGAHTLLRIADILLKHLFRAPRECPAFVLTSFEERAVKRGFANLVGFYSSFREQLDYAHTLRYFTWNWQVNALGILGKALRLANAPAEASISKYGLQLLYWISDNSDQGVVRWSSLPDVLRKWPGTGRYPVWHSISMGSAMSIGAIPAMLLQSQLLIRGESTDARVATVRLSEIGQRFLALLHPDCRDADLPFRVDHWSRAGLEASREAMDRYIRTFFGKQKRFTPH